eukprot:9522526-Alexandrium_andersonii.AAC.1
MVTDLRPHAQAAAIGLRLGWPACEYARQVSVQDLTNGGTIGRGRAWPRVLHSRRLTDAIRAA